MICNPDWGPTGENTYRRKLLERLIVNRVTLPDAAIYIPSTQRQG